MPAWSGPESQNALHMNLMLLGTTLSHPCPHHYLQQPCLAYVSAVTEVHPCLWPFLPALLLCQPNARYICRRQQHRKASDVSTVTVSPDFTLSHAEQGWVYPGLAFSTDLLEGRTGVSVVLGWASPSPTTWASEWWSPESQQVCAPPESISLYFSLSNLLHASSSRESLGNTLQE